MYISNRSFEQVCSSIYKDFNGQFSTFHKVQEKINVGKSTELNIIWGESK